MQLGKRIDDTTHLFDEFDEKVYKNCVNQLFMRLGIDDWPSDDEDNIVNVTKEYIGLNISRQFDWQGSYAFG